MGKDSHAEAQELLARLRSVSTPTSSAGRLEESEVADLRRVVPELQAGVLALSRALEEERPSKDGLDASLPSFLGREVDGLAQALAQPEDGAGPNGGIARETASRTIRHLLRAEAVAEAMAEGLESPRETARAVSRPPGAPRTAKAERSSGRAPGPGSRASAPGQPRELAPHEVEAFLRAHRWGVLSTVEREKPYAVPVIYGFDGQQFFFVSGPGRKVTNLEANPAVCLTVAEVAEDGSSWTSAVAMGAAHVVDDLAGRITAFRALRKQRRGAPSRRIADAARLARAHVFRITPDALTGRALETAKAGRH